MQLWLIEYMLQLRLRGHVTYLGSKVGRVEDTNLRVNFPWLTGIRTDSRGALNSRIDSTKIHPTLRQSFVVTVLSRSCDS